MKLDEEDVGSPEYKYDQISDEGVIIVNFISVYMQFYAEAISNNAKA
jgi:hypothetical protein